MNKGQKHDDGKLRYELMPHEAWKEVVKVLSFGANKYGADNWRTVPDFKRRYYAAAMRHLTACWMGESQDPESSAHHLAHATCCLLFLLELEAKA